MRTSVIIVAAIQLLLFSSALAVERVSIETNDIKLDTFVYHPNQPAKAVATFGNLVTPFGQILHLQLTDLALKTHWPTIDSDENQKVSESEYIALKENLPESLKFLNIISFQEIDVSMDSLITYNEFSRAVAKYYAKTGHAPSEKMFEDIANYFESFISRKEG